jgi:hypothetical protein
MQQTEENLKLVTKKLSRFMNWPGFPKAKDDMQARTRLFCKMVQNKTAREIFGKDDPDVGADTNDMDWLLDTIAESLEAFPSHAAMRRIYVEYFPIEDDLDIKKIQALAAGDVW